jgi:signal transduction histidine kinase
MTAVMFRLTPQLSALPAALFSILFPLVRILPITWPPPQLTLYAVLAGAYLVLVAAAVHWNRPQVTPQQLLQMRLILIALGPICAALLAISGDGLIQPIAVTVPFVIILLREGNRHAVPAMFGYLSMIAVGLWLHGDRAWSGYLAALGGYGSLMIFMTAFVGMARAEQLARADADRLAAENARLAAAAAVSAALAERQRIARDLHDTIAQGLAASAMQLEAAQRLLPPSGSRAGQRINRALQITRSTLNDVRNSVWLLASAPAAAETTLEHVISELCRSVSDRGNLPVDYRHDGPAPIIAAARLQQIARIVQEALHNAERHAAAGHCTVRSTVAADQRLVITVSDDGRGFLSAGDAAVPPGQGFGMISMRERAHSIGAGLSITSRPAAGTEIRLELTLSGATDEDPAAHPDR